MQIMVGLDLTSHIASKKAKDAVYLELLLADAVVDLDDPKGRSELIDVK